MQPSAVRTLRLLAMLLAAVALVIPGTALAHGHGKRGHHHRGHHHANRHDDRDHGKGGVLYTTTNDPAGNAVQVYKRGEDGGLNLVETVQTGSPGLAAQPPFTFSIVDSSNSMALAGNLLFVVNDGDNTITSLRTTGNGLKRVDTAASGGILPISLAVSGNLLYVLNERSSSIFAYRFSHSGNLYPIANSARLLSTPFPSGPGAPGTAAAQIGFAPGGQQLVVTERGLPAQHGVIDTFPVNADGTTGPPKSLTGDSVDANPFGFSFNNAGQLLVSNVGFVGPPVNFPDGNPPFAQVGDLSQFAGSASSYNLSSTGDLAAISTEVLSGGRGACWLVLSKDQKYAFVSNTLATGLPPGTGAGAITTYTVGSDGSLTRVGQTDADPGNATDLAVSPDGKFLYMLNPGVFGPPSGIDVFKIGPGGSLMLTSNVTGVPATGLSGLAVS
ncbi:MAG TPA: beta-propeller fold lactonase family protein [Solirubrobacteraceae bacterium]|nr:beta-propeller fold lactonase family protein [Solirubrobacteraceae bacterium]